MKIKDFKNSLLAEVLDYYKIEPKLGDFQYDEDDDYLKDEMSEFDDEDFYPDTDEDEMSEFDDEMEEDDLYPDTNEDEMSEFDDEMEEENPDRAGMIRLVKGAYLVYKRVTPNNNYEELWVYNLGNIKYQTKIRNAILAGTDIDPTTLQSPDAEQIANVSTAGNVQFLHIDGLPN